MACQLDSRLDRFRPGVAEEDRGVLLKWRNLVELLGQLNPVGVVKVRGNVQELLGLFLNRMDDLGMAVARSVDGNAGHKIKIAVAVHIPDFRAPAVVHDKICDAPVRMRHNLAVACEQIASHRTWYVEAGDGFC